MAQPLRRGKTAAVQFSSSLLGTAVDAFRGAGQGFSRVSDTFGEFEKREDEQLTNEAIAARLRGEEPEFNRRVDQEQVRASFDARRINDSNLDTAESARETARLNQAGLRSTNEISAYEAENKEAIFKGNQDEQAARTRNQTVQADARSSAEARAQSLFESTNLIKTNASTIDQAAFQAEEALYQADIEENLPQVEQLFRTANPTASEEEVAAEIESYKETARNTATSDFASGADRWLDTFVNENGFSPEARAASTVGQEDQRFKDEGVRQAGARAERQEIARGERKKSLDNVRDKVNNHGVIFDPKEDLGYRIAESASARKGNKLSDTSSDVKAWLEKMRIPSTDSNIEKAQELIIASGNNRSVMEGAVEAIGAVDKTNKGGWIWDRKFVPKADWEAITANMENARDGIDGFTTGYVEPDDKTPFQGSSKDHLTSLQRAADDAATLAAQDPEEAGNKAEIDLARDNPLPSTTLNEKLIDAISDGVDSGVGKTTTGAIGTGAALLRAPAYILNALLNQRQKQDRDALQEKLTEE